MGTILSYSHYDNFYSITNIKVKDSISFKIPCQTSPFVYPYIIDYKNDNIILCYRMIDTLYIHRSDGSTKEKIPLQQYNISAMHFVNEDSIWFIANDKTYNSYLLLFKNKKIKQEINLKDNLPDSIKDAFIYFTSSSQKIELNNKLYFTFYYQKEIGKNPKHYTYPIIAYYDLLKDTLIINQTISFPYLNNSIYYPHNDMFPRYCPYFCINTRKKEIILSFSYTKTVLILDEFLHLKNKLYDLGTLLFDTIQPFNKPIGKKDDEYYNYSKTIGGLFDLRYLKGQNLYYRIAYLPEKEYGKDWFTRSLYNSDFELINEFAHEIHFPNKFFHVVEWENDSLLLFYEEKNDTLCIYTGILEFKKVNKSKYYAQYLL